MKLPNKIKWADIFLRGPSSAIQILFLLLFWLLSFTKDSDEACLHLIQPFKVICSICLLFVILEYSVSQGLVFFILLQGTLEALPVWRCALALEARDAESWPGPALRGSAGHCFLYGRNWQTLGFPIPHCHPNWVSSCFLIKRVNFPMTLSLHLLLIVCFLTGLSVLHGLNWTLFHTLDFKTTEIAYDIWLIYQIFKFLVSLFYCLVSSTL